MKSVGLWVDMTLLDYLDRQVHEQPEAIAVVDYRAEGRTRTEVTYRQLWLRSHAIAACMLRHGISRGDVVSFQLPNWWQFVAIHLACLRIGATSNPLMPIFRERELLHMLGLARTRLLFVPARFRNFDHQEMAECLRKQLPELEHVVAVADDVELLGHGKIDWNGVVPNEVAPAAPDDVIQILYTSGTTGEAKGVMHTSNTLFSTLGPYRDRLSLSRQDVVLMGSPLAHQTGFMYGMMLPIMLGCRTVIMDVWDPVRASEIVASEGVTYTMGSTPFLSDFTGQAEKEASRFKSLRIFHAAGAPIPRSLVRRAVEFLAPHILSGWGMTENGAVTTTKPDDSAEKVYETDGCALPGMELRVINTGEAPAGPGIEGELQVRGCANFVGYLRRPTLYQTDEDGWFDTGDIARMDVDGYIRISGRTKDIIIRGGENIPVVEIEGLLYGHPKVKEVAIVGIPDERLGERACAVVVPHSGVRLSLNELASFLNDKKVSKHYFPEKLVTMDSLPRTPSGKIQKFALREDVRARFSRGL